MYNNNNNDGTRTKANWFKSVTIDTHTVSFSDKGFMKFTRKTPEGKDQIIVMCQGDFLVEFIQCAELLVEAEKLYREEVAPKKAQTKAAEYAKLQIRKELTREINSMRATVDRLKAKGIAEESATLLNINRTIADLTLELAKVS
jgi:hypothetical protein